MPSRLRLFDVKQSSLPQDSGLCAANTPGVAAVVNACQRRLLYCKEAGPESWHGTWAELGFSVSRSSPYLTLPREVARLEYVDLCSRPIVLNSQWVEYLQFGNGRMPKQFPCQNWPQVFQAYTRNIVPTQVDLTNAPQFITVFLTDTADVGKRVLIQGPDANGQTVYSQDGFNQVTGIYVNLTSPFVTTPLTFSNITGIQKDLTNGPVQIFQQDPTTGVQVLLCTMAPSETTSAYRRYLFNPLPASCCPPAIAGAPQSLTVTAIAKLELIPVVVDTDYTLIQNLEALVWEAQSYRWSKVDNKSAQAMSINAHTQAVRLLNGELGHFYGIDEPAVLFKPFGSASLRRQRIGTML